MAGWGGTAPGPVTAEELLVAEKRLGQFGGDNRAGASREGCGEGRGVDPAPLVIEIHGGPSSRVYRRRYPPHEYQKYFLYFKLTPAL